MLTKAHDPMRNPAYILGVAVLLVLLTLSIPAGAMTADTLTVRLAEDGRAEITFTYRLSWYEHFAVYLRMVNPADELKSALERNFQKPVNVTSIDSGRVDLSIEQFAAVRTLQGQSVLYTPEISFMEAEKILKNYWFAPLVSADFSPSLTTLRFPDGQTLTFDDALVIPPQSHLLSPG